MNNFRVLFIPALEKSVVSTFSVTAKTKEEAELLLNTIANYTLYLHAHNFMSDYSNCGIIEIFEDGEWQEIEEDE